MKKLLPALLFILTCFVTLHAQEYPDFNKKEAVHFRFRINDRSEIPQLTKIISIDNLKGNDVYAFATRNEFKKFSELGYTWTLLPMPSEEVNEQDLNMGNIRKSSSGRTIWNFYPTYDQYLEFMAGFANEHPDICRLDTIGTSIQGRLILAVKISDSVGEDQAEPEVLLTSSIHGDEVTGYVLMLHLIDSILTSYSSVPRIADIVNNTQLYINPLANPDGTYKGGNNTVAGAWRYNSAGIDLNRNFADPKDGPHPDGNPWQKETKFFMRYDTIHSFTLSMNFHGGAEVYNYPWDTWAKLHADDSWLNFSGREYADTVHKYAPSYYMIDLDNGVTNGHAWYEINGGRQDYTTYFHYGREITLEISSIKLLPTSQLLKHWDYNKRSFLNFIEEAGYGINGQVTDTVTGHPLKAKVFISGHDIDNSFVYSDSIHGWYYRLIDQGNWALTFTCPGYYTKTIAVDAERRNTTRENVQLVPLTYAVNEINDNSHALKVFPNPASDLVNIIMPVDREMKGALKVISAAGKVVLQQEFRQNSGEPVVRLPFKGIAPGNYIIEIIAEGRIMTSKVTIK